MSELINLLFEYSKKNKYFDQEVIKKIIISVCDSKNLNNYINKVTFEQTIDYWTINEKQLIPAAYIFTTKEIVLDELIIKNACEYISKEYPWEFNAFERKMIGNVLIIMIILHEIEHANQLRNSSIVDDSFENLLLRICKHTDNLFLGESKRHQFLFEEGKMVKHFKYMYINDELKKKYESSSPIERLANIYSIKELVHNLKPLLEDIPNIRRYLEASLIDVYIKHYEMKSRIPAPTIRYLKDFQSIGIAPSYFDENFDKVLTEASTNSLAKRLILGLNITEDEYLKTKRILKQKKSSLE